MTHVDPTAFSDNQINVIRRFHTALESEGVVATIFDFELGEHKNREGDPLEPIRMCIIDVRATRPEEMYKAGFSLAEICAVVDKMPNFLPPDFMPSKGLIACLVEQFWNHQRDLAESGAAASGWGRDD